MLSAFPSVSFFDEMTFRSKKVGDPQDAELLGPKGFPLFTQHVRETYVYTIGNLFFLPLPMM